MKTVNNEPKVETHFFKDDGNIPNSKYPLTLYHDALTESGDKAADLLEQRFSSNKWTNAWRWGVYDYHHYHSNTHEVLGVFKGWAVLQLGGPNGKKLKVEAGDIMVIPAGVAHKCIEAGDGFEVVGSYPDGLKPDLNKGKEGERPQTDRNISEVAFPSTDPWFGEGKGIIEIWRNKT